ncbi:MAG: CRTAC1 family protein [Notoacmeibacter sp.]
MTLILRFAPMAIALLFSSAAPAAEPVPAPLMPGFVEETAASGIDQMFQGDWQYMVGGGVATFDCNDDGFEDALISGGKIPAKFFRNVSKPGGELRFLAETSGLELDAVLGTYPVDINGDGKVDLVLLRVGENVVMKGEGACQFTRANEEWNFDGGDAWSTSLAATWEKGANWPTIAIGNYIDRKEEFSPWGSCTDNWLHRPAGTEQKFATPFALKPSHCPLSIMFTDWNRSGTPSLRVSNDREYYEGGQEQMWKVEPGKEPVLFTDKDGWKPLRIWGMGIASTDLDGDRFPEYFLTSMADNKLQTLGVKVEGGAPQPATFKDIAFAKGVTAHRPYFGEDLKPSTAWHAQFEDVNNDGLADLFVAKGNVDKMPDFAAKDPNNLLLQASDGKFVEAGQAAGVASVAQSRGASFADFNLDGLLDLIVVNRGEPAQIWRNTTKDAGNWFNFKLSQASPNNNAIGSWLEIKTGDKIHSREVFAGAGHASGHLGWLHMATGNNTEAEVRVIWPDGTAGEWEKLKTNAHYVLERGKAAAKWVPAG